MQETLPLANGTEGFVYSRTDVFQRLIHCNVCMRANIPANALYIHDEQDLHVNLLSHYRNETQNVLMKSASIYQMFSSFCDMANQSRFQHIGNEHQLCVVGSDTLLEIENGGFMCMVCRKENIGDIEVAAHLESTEHVIFYVVILFCVIKKMMSFFHINRSLCQISCEYFSFHCYLTDALEKDTIGKFILV